MTNGSLATGTILIVDDTPTNIAVISHLLTNEGYRTKVATNGERALKLIAAELPDLILLDVSMPGLDGYQVCERLKADPTTVDIPIIFLTAQTDSSGEAHGLTLGAVDYIHKPVSEMILLARVRTQLRLRRALHEARTARDETDGLLDALLPKAAADEIRATGAVIPRRYENVAVLFCDIANFTSFCDQNEPEAAVSQLDSVFAVFEHIAERRGLEKIKTVGDAFMAAAGLLEPHPDPLGASVRAGLEMAEAVADASTGWAARVGVHIGPVVAGVVGARRYQFDIWGDTVNVASRITGTGAAGMVAVTNEVWEKLRDSFEGEPLGLHHFKGKGTMPVVQITGEKSARAVGM